MSGLITPYQGGIPNLYTRSGRAGQHGGGFFSSLKRFLIPIGKAILPSLAGGAGDLLSGRGVKETLKKRGLDAGKSALGAVLQTAGGGGGGGEEEATTATPSKKYKRAPAPRKGSVSSQKKKRKGPSSAWQ